MDREGVHDRSVTLRGPIGLAEVQEKPGRRVGLPRAGRIVGSAWGQPGADHLHVRPHGFYGVIRGGEELLECDRRGIATRGVELRQPEQVEVGFVADDQVVDVRQPAHQRCCVCGEVRVVGRRHRRLRAELVDGDDRPDLLGRSRCARSAQGLELCRRGRPRAARPDRAERNRTKARLTRPRQLGMRIARLRRVLHRTDDELRSMRAATGREQPYGGEGGDPAHDDNTLGPGFPNERMHRCVQPRGSG